MKLISKGNTMPTLSKTSSMGRALLLCFAPLLFILLSSYSVQGASLREHRLRGSELDTQRGPPRQTPNADMLKALEYIEDLRQKSGTALREQQTPLTPGHGANTEKLGATAQNKAQPGQGEDKEEEEEGNGEDKSQEWLQAVLRTLEETEKADGPPADEGTNRWAQRQRGTGRPHKRLPLMFEDDEEDEGGEGKEEEADGDGPFKRTSEDLEGKYTPQNLAALQSMFEELGRLANAEASHKRQAEDDGGEEEDEEMKEEEGDGDDGLFNVRKLDYEDPAGGQVNWGLPEEQEEEEEEEEERDKKHAADQGLGYGQDEEDEDDEEGGEEDEDRYPVKRSGSSGPGDNPDDMANLVDYYLLKVLEKTEEEEHKRELEEEEEEEEEEEKRRADRRVHPSQYRDNIDPQAIYQLIQISQKLQIPPEDLVDMLKTGEMAKQDKALTRGQPQSRKSSELSKHSGPEANLLQGHLPGRQSGSSTPEDLTIEEILHTLGLGSVRSQDTVPLPRQKQHKSSQSRHRAQPQRQGDYSLPQRRVLDNLKGDYDDAASQDDLAAYLAAQILSQFSDATDDKAGQKRAAHRSDHQSHLGLFEQVMQYYLNQLDSDESQDQKRQEGAAHTQSWDNEALAKMMSYLNPESEELDNADATPAEGM